MKVTKQYKTVLVHVMLCIRATCSTDVIICDASHHGFE